MRILLAVDGSAGSEEALEEVLYRPWPNKSEIRVICVIETPPLAFVGLPSAYFTDLTGPIESHARQVIKAATDKLKAGLNNAIEVFGEVLRGTPKKVIVEEAERWGSDLIIIGARNHDGWNRLLAGSISQSVMTHANCSVEVVRHHQ